MYETDPARSVWGVLGESGGGCGSSCGGGGCGGGGCGSGCGGGDGGGDGGGGADCGGGAGDCGGGADCGAGDCSGGGERRRRSPKAVRNFSKQGAGIGCGAGIHKAACGVGNIDSSDTRRKSTPKYFTKQRIAIENSARCKLVCDIAIIPKCLNMFQLPDAPVSEYIIRAPYDFTYQYEI